MKNIFFKYNVFVITKKIKVSRKKIRKTKKSGLSPEIQRWIIGMILLFLAVLALILDEKSTFWDFFINVILNPVFWENFKFIFSPFLILLSFFIFTKKDFEITPIKWFGSLFFFISLVSILWFFDKSYNAYFDLSMIFISTFGYNATILIFFALFISSILISYQVNFSSIFNFSFDSISLNHSSDSKTASREDKALIKNRDKLIKEIDKLENKKEDLLFEIEKLQEKLEQKQLSIDEVPESNKKKSSFFSMWWNTDSKDSDNFVDNNTEDGKSSISNMFTKKTIKVQKATVLDKDITDNSENSTNSDKTSWADYSSWKFPSLDFLKDWTWNYKIDKQEIFSKWQEIKEKLRQFKINVDVESFNVWPTVVQYRLDPHDWVKLNKIENLKKDLTLALKAKSIRIQAPIPGEWVVWVEVPNEDRQVVWLKDILNSGEFNNPKNKLPICLWKDISGKAIVWDLTKMPHLLVAWQTASWKSVWMNGFLLSLLYKYSPEDLKFIMIDPKMVELSVYNWIPHLLSPVITSPDKATNALKWAVAEMLRRYDLQRQTVARNVEEYNAKVNKDKKLPYIVIVIDELADLMMSWDKKEVETSIARIAQMARAVWMHLIVATQRPSVDIITWLIKANIPSRIAFTVASQIDSRTVLDRAWAEDLLWRGDMLFYPTGSPSAERVQWVLVETEEVEEIVNFLKLNCWPLDYDSSIVNGKSNLEGSVMENYNWDMDEDPEIVEKAIEIVKQAKKGSTSLIQRKLWLWYARAAKVLDILEDLWVVWPSNWSKPRDVFID